MKKIFAFLIIFIFSISLNSCFFVTLYDKFREKIYEGWQTIYLPSIGRFKVPQEWFIKYENYTMYITDKPFEEEDYKIYLVGRMWVDQEDGNYILTHELFENTTFVKATRSTLLSNGAHYGQNEYEIDSKKEIKFYFEYNSFMFIAWDNLLNEKMIEKIADSFVME